MAPSGRAVFTFSVLTFGCRLNQADSLASERCLAAHGGVPASADTAQVVIVNTCSVTAAADQAARNAIRRVARCNPGARLVATGCYATGHPEELAGLPGGVRVLPNSAKDHFAECLADLLPPGAVTTRVASRPAGRGFPAPGHHGRTVHPLRVQTGCDERCSYCSIPSTRGPSRSRPAADVLGEARAVASVGYKECVITGVHLGAYGRDLVPASSLFDLLSMLDRLPSDLSFRLSSLEPMDCTPEVVRLITASGRFAPHFHLPLQHASARILAAMRRPYSPAEYRSLLDLVLTTLPDAAVGADIIVGFPGEREEDHEELASYLESSGLAYVHVFPYSDRPGTEASAMASKVAPADIDARSARLRTVAATLNRRFVQRQVGQVRAALTVGDGTRVVTDNYLKVAIGAGRPRNERVRVRIRSAVPLTGEVVS